MLCSPCIKQSCPFPILICIASTADRSWEAIKEQLATLLSTCQEGLPVHQEDSMIDRRVSSQSFWVFLFIKIRPKLELDINDHINPHFLHIQFGFKPQFYDRIQRSKISPDITSLFLLDLLLILVYCLKELQAETRRWTNTGPKSYGLVT